MMEVTMSQHDFTLLRAKNYDNTVIVNKKKNYSCHFCTFLTPLFNFLKLHIKKHHLDEGVTSSPTHSLLAPRSQSDESVLAAPTPAKPKSRRSSFSASKVAKARLDSDGPQPTSTVEEQLAQATISKNDFHCQECTFRSKYKSAMLSHLKSKKHEAQRSRSRKALDGSHSRSRGRSRKSTDVSQTKSKSPGESRSRGQSKPAKSKSPEKSRSRGRQRKLISPSSSSDFDLCTNKPKISQKANSRSKSNKSPSPSKSSKSPNQTKQVSPKSSTAAQSKKRLSRTPGLGTFVCVACECSSNDDVEMSTHLMSNSHGKKTKTCQEKKYLSCNVCMFNTDRRDDLIKHMRTKKHIKTLTSVKKQNFEKPKVLDQSPEKPKSAEKPGKDSKKQSRFDRNIKKTKALSRESCVYGTPEEIIEESVSTKRSREVPNPKNVQNPRKPKIIESPRKVPNPKNVQNPRKPKIIESR